LDSDPLNSTLKYPATNWLGNYVHSTSYIDTNCDFTKAGALSDFPDGVLEDMSVSLNMTRKTAIGYPRITLWARNFNSTARISCNLETHLVDLQALCNADACIIKGIKPTHPDYIRPASIFNNATFAQLFFDNMLLAAGRPDSILDKDGTVITQMLYGHFFDGDGNPASPVVGFSIAQYLTMFINTYMQVSQPLTNGTNIPVFDLFDNHTRINSIIDNQTFIGDDGKPFYFSMNGTQQLEDWPYGLGDGAIYNPRYTLDPIWIAIDLMTCLILICAATFSIWLRLNTVAPDIFGCKFIIVVMVTSYSQPLFKAQPHFKYRTTTIRIQSQSQSNRDTNHNPDSIIPIKT
jgi:hypothetical protein